MNTIDIYIKEITEKITEDNKLFGKIIEPTDYSIAIDHYFSSILSKNKKQTLYALIFISLKLMRNHIIFQIPIYEGMKLLMEYALKLMKKEMPEIKKLISSFISERKFMKKEIDFEHFNNAENIIDLLINSNLSMLLPSGNKYNDIFKFSLYRRLITSARCNIVFEINNINAKNYPVIDPKYKSFQEKAKVLKEFGMVSISLITDEIPDENDLIIKLKHLGIFDTSNGKLFNPLDYFIVEFLEKFIGDDFVDNLNTFRINKIHILNLYIEFHKEIIEDNKRNYSKIKNTCKNIVKWNLLN